MKGVFSYSLWFSCVKDLPSGTSLIRMLVEGSHRAQEWCWVFALAPGEPYRWPTSNLAANISGGQSLSHSWENRSEQIEVPKCCHRSFACLQTSTQRWQGKWIHGEPLLKTRFAQMVFASLQLGFLVDRYAWLCNISGVYMEPSHIFC